MMTMMMMTNDDDGDDDDPMAAVFAASRQVQVFYDFNFIFFPPIRDTAV